MIETIGWIYFGLSIVGIIILMISAFSRDFGELNVNYTYIIYAVILFIQSIMVTAICVALSDLLENTEKILKKQDR